MPPIFQHAITLIARIMLSLVFILSGANCLIGWGQAANRMAAKGMDLRGVLGSGGTVLVHAMLAGTVVLLLIGGLSVLLGLRARWGAVVLIAFLVPATLIFHNFWTLGADSARQVEMVSFMKNLGLIGGLMMIVAFGSGGFSIELFLPRRRKPGEF